MKKAEEYTNWCIDKTLDMAIVRTIIKQVQQDTIDATVEMCIEKAGLIEVRELPKDVDDTEAEWNDLTLKYIIVNKESIRDVAKLMKDKL